MLKASFNSDKISHGYVYLTRAIKIRDERVNRYICIVG